jgi:hypothetical protein
MLSTAPCTLTRSMCAWPIRFMLMTLEGLFFFAVNENCDIKAFLKLEPVGPAYATMVICRRRDEEFGA